MENKFLPTQAACIFNGFKERIYRIIVLCEEGETQNADLSDPIYFCVATVQGHNE